MPFWKRFGSFSNTKPRIEHFKVPSVRRTGPGSLVFKGPASRLDLDRTWIGRGSLDFGGPASHPGPGSDLDRWIWELLLAILDLDRTRIVGFENPC